MIARREWILSFNQQNGTFQYLSRVIAQCIFDEGKVVLTPSDENVLQNPCTDDPVVRTEYPLSPCNHEQFDTRVMLHVHATNASSQGYEYMLIVEKDTDIIVLRISFLLRLVQKNYGYHLEQAKS